MGPTGRSTALAVVLKKTPLLNARSGTMQTTIIGQTSLNTTAGLRSDAAVRGSLRSWYLFDANRPRRQLKSILKNDLREGYLSRPRLFDFLGFWRLLGLLLRLPHRFLAILLQQRIVAGAAISSRRDGERASVFACAF